MKRLSFDVLTACWYAIARNEAVRSVMASTPGSVELATAWWLQEDTFPVPSSLDVPSASGAFERLLRKTDPRLLNRVMHDKGAKVVSETAIKRYKDEISKPMIVGVRASVYSDVLNQLSRSPNHVLRHNLLARGVVQWPVKGAIAACQQMPQSPDPNLIDSVVASFGYLGNCLESSDGFTWVAQAIRAGLLTAFVECSPHLHLVEDPDDRDLIVLVIRDILPQYLVYRSVLDAVEKALPAVETPASSNKVRNSLAAKPWATFHKLAKERIVVCMSATALKDYGKICDNVKVVHFLVTPKRLILI